MKTVEVLILAAAIFAAGLMTGANCFPDEVEVLPQWEAKLQCWIPDDGPAWILCDKAE